MSGHFTSFWAQMNRIWSLRTQKRTSSRRNLHAHSDSFRAIPVETELLDLRKLLSATNAAGSQVAEPTIQLDKSFATPGPTGYTPAQLQAAYGFNRLSIPSGSNGTGQTIAIVDAYNAPTIQSDLQAFDRAYGLANPPSLTVMSQTGSTTSLPPTDPSTDKQDDWEIEESLDVEWAHALAPGAKIVLVEANSDNDSDLMAAVRTAENLPGVSVVSMSWGGGESPSDPSQNSLFTTPSGHQGVTFVASTGDDGVPGGFPAYSPNVVAVGGTTLNLNSAGTYLSESGWSGSGGGISQYEAQPAYQHGIVTQSTTKRTIPDVSFDADPNTGVGVYDTFSNGTAQPWAQIGGTSLAAPSWAAIIAIVDQQRAQNGLTSLDGATQTLPMLYQLDQTNPSAFHDITSGNNGYAAGPGYDLVTGLGSPVVNTLVTALGGSSTTSVSKLVFQQAPTTGTAGQVLGSSVTVAIENQNGQIITNNDSTVTISIGSGPGGFASGSRLSVAAVNGIATFSDLVLDVAGSYTFSATDTGMTNGTSNAITINPAAAAKLVFVQSPSSGSVGQTLAPSVSVAVEDQFGNVVTANRSTVTISVGSGSAGFSAGSTTSVTAVNGIATFSNLTLGTAGQYVLKATETGLTSASSSSFTVSAGLAVPQNVSVVDLTSTSVKLSWSAVAGTQGYRIFEVNGSQSSLLGSVGSTMTSVNVTGLTAGSTVSFKVEAFSGSSVGDSQVVTITLPTNQLQAPALSVQVLSSSSVELMWTPVAGAQGYNIYWSDGVYRYFLGSVGANASSTRIVGLSSWSQYGFQVEAFQGSVVQDSNWVWIETGSAKSRAVVETSPVGPDNFVGTTSSTRGRR